MKEGKYLSNDETLQLEFETEDKLKFTERLVSKIYQCERIPSEAEV